MSRKTRRNKRRKQKALMTPDVAVSIAVAAPEEREPKILGGISKLAAKGATSLLRGAKDDVAKSLKSLEKKLTSKPSDPNVVSFTTKELTEQKKLMGEDEYRDYLSEFSIIRDQDEAIAKEARDQNTSFEDVASYVKRSRPMSSVELKAVELKGQRYEKILKEEENFTEEMLFEIKKRNDNYVDYVSDLEEQLRFFNKVGFQEGGKAQKSKFPDLTGDGKVTQADILHGRGVFQEGGEVPIDTYPNIPPNEMEAVMASQLPDQEMEDQFIDYVINESLNNEEQRYLMNALEGDPRLSVIFDKVVGTASEFTGSGEVKGPGTGVSDSIPARLSDGEFVFTRKATDQLGADNLQRMMDDAERAYDGGMMRVDEEDEKADTMNKIMMSANQMPSLNVRQR